MAQKLNFVFGKAEKTTVKGANAGNRCLNSTLRGKALNCILVNG